VSLYYMDLLKGSLEMLTKIKIGIAVLVLVLSNFGTYKYMVNKHKAEQLKAVVKEVENDNEDKKELAEHTKILEKIEIEYRDRIIEVPAIDTSKPCPIPDITRMRNEVNASLPDVYFESTDEVSEDAR